MNKNSGVIQTFNFFYRFNSLVMNKLNFTVVLSLIFIFLFLGLPEGSLAMNQCCADSFGTARDQQEDNIRYTVLSYLSQPYFSNSDFMEQITKTEARFHLFDLREGMIYLSIPYQYFSVEVLNNLTENPIAAEFGRTPTGMYHGNRIRLGDYILRKPGSYYLRIKSDDFKVNEACIINIPFERVTYSISMPELQGFIENSSIYGGYLSVDTGLDEYERQHILSNHGAFIAVKGEPSLARLAASLTRDASSKKRKAQVLLDFVTEELPYDFYEANQKVEILKRPNEVLMTRGSDCSGKVILYASLLEQINIDYILVYMNGHIVVAVEGNYPNFNGLNFYLSHKRYSIAETTAEGFQIGISCLGQSLSIEDIKYIQKPGVEAKLYDVRVWNALPFI